MHTTDSSHSVKATVDRLVSALERRGIAVFARIDHAGAARAAGLELGDEELLVFGDPRVGTLLMQSDPAVGYELPLRVLVWDAGEGTKVGYRLPQELAGDFALSARAEVLERMAELLAALVAESTSAA